jgi:hypothetical protein
MITATVKGTQGVAAQTTIAIRFLYYLLRRRTAVSDPELWRMTVAAVTARILHPYWDKLR